MKYILNIVWLWLVVKFIIIEPTINSSVVIKIPNATDSIVMTTPPPKASFDLYIETPLRQTLISDENDATKNPRADDAGNWTGCRRGVGKLIGTYRDISACAYKAHYGIEPTKQMLRNLTYEDAKSIYKRIWDGIYGDSIKNQRVANITMHCKVHFGNLGVVRNAVKKLSGESTIKTNKQLIELLNQQIQKDSINTYRAIRSQLEYRYNRANPVYRKGFIKFLNRYFEKI